MNLRGKHALVTGGGSGVGAAIALHLAEQGARVTITGRRLEALEAVAQSHENIAPAACDVTSQTQVQAAFGTARAEQGPIDIVVANAGIATSTPFAKMTADDLQSMLDVNLIGVFNSFQAGLPDMLSTGWGRMIVVASTAGLKGYGYVSGYCASKHAVVGMMRSLAIEVAQKGITVNAVCPSYVDTPMTQRTVENIMAKTGMDQGAAIRSLTQSNPQGRLIQPLEVADTVAFLCGDQAASINGQTLALSGGET